MDPLRRIWTGAHETSAKTVFGNLHTQHWAVSSLGWPARWRPWRAEVRWSKRRHSWYLPPDRCKQSSLIFQTKLLHAANLESRFKRTRRKLAGALLPRGSLDRIARWLWLVVRSVVRSVRSSIGANFEWPICKNAFCIRTWKRGRWDNVTLEDVYKYMVCLHINKWLSERAMHYFFCFCFNWYASAKPPCRS